MRPLVVLPTYNEAENVLPMTTAVLAADERIEVLVVDDNSPDGTADLVRQAQEGEPRLHMIERPGKMGLGSAYLTAFKQGMEQGYTHLLEMDCDFSHHPKYLPDLLRAAEEGADLVIGSRYVPGGGVADWPIHRRALSSFANLYTRILLRVPVHDCTAGFRCYRSDMLEAINPFQVKSSGYSFQEEMVWLVSRSGYDIVEVPIVFEDRRLGESKINHSEIYRAAFHVLRTAFRRSPPKKKA